MSIRASWVWRHIISPPLSSLCYRRMIGIWDFLDIETHWTFALLYLISVAICHFLIVYYCFRRKIYVWPLVWMRIPKPSWLVQVFFPGSKLFHGNWRPQESTGQSLILSIVPENSQEDYTCICKSQSDPVHVASVPSLVFSGARRGKPVSVGFFADGSVFGWRGHC